MNHKKILQWKKGTVLCFTLKAFLLDFCINFKVSACKMSGHIIVMEKEESEEKTFLRKLFYFKVKCDL